MSGSAYDGLSFDRSVLAAANFLENLAGPLRVGMSEPLAGGAEPGGPMLTLKCQSHAWLVVGLIEQVLVPNKPMSDAKHYQPDGNAVRLTWGAHLYAVR